MFRYFLALLIMTASLGPAAAFAQTGPADSANAVDTATTTTTTNSTETVNSTETADTAETANTGETANMTGGNGTDDSSERTAPTEVNRSVLDASGEALLKLFVLALILESALALLFNWRPFVARYDGRGVKAPISLAAALFLVFVFKPDAIAGLMDGYDADAKETGKFFARFIEAMVVAGGSAGVNRLLVGLGFRSVTRTEEVIPRPKRDEAWISVGLDRDKAVGPVLVEVTVEGERPAIAGTIAGTRAAKRSYFRRDYGRLPPAGGIPVPPGKTVEIRLLDQANTPSPIWGPYRLAPQAIVDIDLTL